MPNISFVLFYIYAYPKHAQNTQDPGTGISRQKLRNLLYVRDVTGCDWGGRGRLPRGRHDKEASPASHRVRWALGPTSPLPQRRRVLESHPRTRLHAAPAPASASPTSARWVWVGGLVGPVLTELTVLPLPSFPVLCYAPRPDCDP